MKATQDVARICRVLSVDTRVRILELLRAHTLCVGALANRLNVTQGAVSQHLRILRDAGLVESDRQGYYVHYTVNQKALAECQDVLLRFLKPEVHPKSCIHEEKGDSACVPRRPSVRSRTS